MPVERGLRRALCLTREPMAVCHRNAAALARRPQAPQPRQPSRSSASNSLWSVPHEAVGRSEPNGNLLVDGGQVVTGPSATGPPLLASSNAIATEGLCCIRRCTHQQEPLTGAAIGLDLGGDDRTRTDNPLLANNAIGGRQGSARARPIRWETVVVGKGRPRCCTSLLYFFRLGFRALHWTQLHDVAPSAPPSPYFNAAVTTQRSSHVVHGAARQTISLGTSLRPSIGHV